MPKHINYETTAISFYKFVCEDENIKSNYVGHTSNFKARKSCHKSCCNIPNSKGYNFKIYTLIRENGGWTNWRMIEIEKKIVKDKREAERIEQELIEKLNADMNTHKAFINSQEDNRQRSKKFYLDNFEKVSIQMKKYYVDNIEKIKVYRKQKYACNCGSSIGIDDKARHFKSKKHLRYISNNLKLD